jgi:hypothetical protein
MYAADEWLVNACRDADLRVSGGKDVDKDYQQMGPFPIPMDGHTCV